MGRRAVLILLLCLAVSAPALAQKRFVDNQLGFSLVIPSDWLRNRSPQRLELAKGNVWVKVEPYSGITMPNQVERLKKLESQSGADLKQEKSFVVNQVPCHSMIFYNNDKYRIYYVFMSGQRGYLWTIDSPTTDSHAFDQAENMFWSFQVLR